MAEERIGEHPRIGIEVIVEGPENTPALLLRQDLGALILVVEILRPRLELRLRRPCPARHGRYGPRLPDCIDDGSRIPVWNVEILAAKAPQIARRLSTGGDRQGVALEVFCRQHR